VKTIVQHRYGGPQTLEFVDASTPEPAADEVLVRVEAASVNPYDWHLMTGRPWPVRIQNGMRRPAAPVGADGAGVVEAVGAEVTGLSPGDEVFGTMRGSWSEFAVARPASLAIKPPQVTFEQAASVPIAGLTALQGLRDVAAATAGDRVLINGASGGVGTFGVMIAKTMGAHVTAVGSTGNVELMASLGADEVIDYTRSDYTRGHTEYDAILDTVTTKGVFANRRVMADGAIWAGAGMKRKRSATLIMLRMLKRRLLSIGHSTSFRSYLSRVTAADLEVLADYLASRAVVPAIDRTYPLSDAAAAMAYQGEGHARGKTILAI